jgi:hypothetical protein
MCGVNLCPCFYDRDNLRRCEVGEGDIVLRGESEDEAFACYGVCAKEERREIWSEVSERTYCWGVEEHALGVSLWLVFRLLCFHCTVVVHEHKCAFVFGVGIALCALVSGTEVALWKESGGVNIVQNGIAYRWIVIWKCYF